MELPKKIIKLRDLFNTVLYKSDVYISVDLNPDEYKHYNFVFHYSNSEYEMKIKISQDEDLEKIVLHSLIGLKHKYKYMRAFSSSFYSSLETCQKNWEQKNKEEKKILPRKILEQHINKVKEGERDLARKIEQLEKQENAGKRNNNSQKPSFDSKDILIWLAVIGFWVFIFSGVIWPDKKNYSNGRTLDCSKPENSYQCDLLEQKIYESEIQDSQFNRLPY
ncbi:hypothetical protein [Aequorivita vladivostokensis]|uniref:Uncharacterized protein n=1 Tax=Aequorivita vladivostokensis TaxID=171194 RepID=A0ABR5DM55_9FLAO|nr:hypothetical protein [Aequorivita vladivostokensis]KJJ39865.1 hypothetical protein MB09_01460 [Aequorivita vladivostokensis]